MSFALPFKFIVLGCTLCILQTAGASNKPVQIATEEKRNVILIVADDLGWGDLSCHGNPVLETPNIDLLAAQGTQFNRYYTSPLGAPTRASLLTGRYHFNVGVYGNSGGYEVMSEEARTMAEIFKDNGYQTGCFGKWSNGHNYPHTANAQGFDLFFGFNSTYIRNYFNPNLLRNDKPVKTNGFITDILTDETIAFIHKNKDRPFFAYVPYNAPRSPFQCPDDEFYKYKVKGLDDKTSAIYGMIDNLDQNVGRMMAALDNLELDKKTLVIFTSDNGPSTKRFNAGLKGIKGSMNEGGTRVPFILRLPGKILPGNTSNWHGSAVNIAPTIYDICELDWQSENLDDSTLYYDPKFKPIKGFHATEADYYIYTHHIGTDGILSKNYGSVTSRYLRLTVESDGPYSEETKYQLFDLLNDPTGSTSLPVNLEDSPAFIMNIAWEDINRSIPKDSARRTKAGRPGGGTVHLPATNVSRVTSVFNSTSDDSTFFAGTREFGDYIINWTDTDKAYHWSLEVSSTMTYEVVMEYACTKGQEGSLIEFKVGDQKFTKKLDKAHPGLVYPDLDRNRHDPNREVHERDWGYFSLGKVEFPAGKYDLTLSATEIKSKVCDLYGIRLVPSP